MGNTLSKDYARARKGSIEAYLSIVVRYQSLAFGFYRMSGVADVTKAMNHTQRLFYTLWRDIRTILKLLDFEKELIHRLQKFTLEESAKVQDPRIASFLRLSARDRLLAVTIEIENWNLSRTAKSFQISRFTLEKDLLRVRCDSIGVHFINLGDGEKKVLREMSTHFCRDLSRKHRQRMADATIRCNELREFKSRCLEKRCELVELWLDLRLTADEQEWLLQGVRDLLGREEWQGISNAVFSSRWFSFFRRNSSLHVS